MSYTFGPYKIDAKEVFYSTPLSYAMVNLRPLLPGKLSFLLISSSMPLIIIIYASLWFVNFICSEVSVLVLIMFSFTLQVISFLCEKLDFVGAD